VQPGSQPSWISGRVIEKAPVMIDWLAMMVAIVPQRPAEKEGRAQPVEDVVRGWRSFEDQGRLPA
jgi:hypothetical protein